MLKYPCLVLDHDDTVVQSMKTLSYPFFCEMLEKFRPGMTISLADYVRDCHNMGFAELCRHRFQFTAEETREEHNLWMNYIRTHIPAAYPGIDKVIRRQKESGGLVCVVSHSGYENITRDYRTHFGMQPDTIYGWDLPEEQRKPNAYPLLDIMEKYSLSPSHLLVVDDMKLAWKMAHPVGVKIAYAGWNGMGIPEVEKEMTALCDYSFHSTEELEKFLFD